MGHAGIDAVHGERGAIDSNIQVHLQVQRPGQLRFDNSAVYLGMNDSRYGFKRQARACNTV